MRSVVLSGAWMVPFSLCAAASPLLLGCGSVSASDEATGVTGALSTTSPPATTQLSAEEWRKGMLKKSLPKKKGCFHAKLPETEWHEDPCVSIPPVPHVPATVGNNFGDFMATTAAPITFAKGSFPSQTNPLIENDNQYGPSAYSLQMNSNTFPTAACIGSPNPMGCRGWQQFLADISPGFDSTIVHTIYIQYWLLFYNTGCPSGWMTYIDPLGNTNCYMNSSGSIEEIPDFSLGTISLTDKTLSGTATNGNTDIVAFASSDAGDTLTAVGQDSVLGLQNNWTAVEFNVFGFITSSQADFNSATLGVALSINDGTYAAPTCNNASTTGETNNLTIVSPSCCPAAGDLVSGTYQAISFVETNVSPSVPAFCLLNVIAPLITPSLF